MSQPNARHEYVIRSPRGLDVNFRELWEYRELFGALAMRAVLGRYRQTIIGVLWAVVRPVVTMVTLTIVFNRVGKMASGDTPYLLFALAGVVPWLLFSHCITGASASLVTSAEMIKKVYFPRLIIPAAACMTALVDFLVSLAVFAAMMLIVAWAPTWRLVLLPAATLLALLAALGPALWLSALNARYRDVMHLVPFLMTIGMFISPVGYASGQVAGPWRWLYSLNPMVSVIDSFRWVLVGDAGGVGAAGFGLSVAVVAALLVSGLAVFRYMERTFADVI